MTKISIEGARMNLSNYSWTALDKNGSKILIYILTSRRNYKNISKAKPVNMEGQTPRVILLEITYRISPETKIDDDIDREGAQNGDIIR